MPDGRVDALSREVAAACRDWGFFVVLGHGIPDATVTRVAEASRAFFGQPAERKAAVRRTDDAPLIGYHEAEYTIKDVRDWKEVYDVHPRCPPPGETLRGDLVLENKWPQDLPGFRQMANKPYYSLEDFFLRLKKCMSCHALEEYGKEMEILAFKLLGLLARSLSLRPDRLHGFFKDQTTIMRLNYYPPCPNPGLALGHSAHRDGSAFTIIYQDDVGGFDIRRRTDGQWLRVKPIQGSFIVVIGEIIQVWSNGKYKSLEHRASLNAEKERFSIPFFFNPASSTTIEPLPETVRNEDPPRYSSYNWGEYYGSRRKGSSTTYAGATIAKA
ncbi:hypothetical protein HU200_038451 [Digitaria exilis]|uniref:Fe2OG dioxygenase domain-containing protein n=1 Tax=Digitaria exilis TaxID=1010633 RepID=A0A835BP50_9POAL|nr:hypothetical protein HU200_038451 [Digitaria exilis]